MCRPECDENVICKEFDVGFGHGGVRFDEGEELGGVHGSYHVTGVEDCALDFEISAGFGLGVVVVDHALDFGGLDDWIECFYLICDLYHLSYYGFPRDLRCWRMEIGIEALKEVTKTFGADRVLVQHTRPIGKPPTVLVYLRRSVSHPHLYKCVPDLLG